jgi:hypothetical protein
VKYKEKKKKLDRRKESKGQSERTRRAEITRMFIGPAKESCPSVLHKLTRTFTVGRSRHSYNVSGLCVHCILRNVFFQIVIINLEIFLFFIPFFQYLFSTLL